MSALVRLQLAVRGSLSKLSFLTGVPVLAAEEGNVVAEWDERCAASHLAVTVGAAGFTPSSRDSRVLAGMMRLDVTVLERPTRNRVGQRRVGPTATEAAEAIANALQLAPIGDGVLVLGGIGGVERIDDQTIARTVRFETLATLGAG